MKRLTSPVARPAWQALVVSLGALLLAAVLVALGSANAAAAGGALAGIAGPLLAVGWLAAVRFMLLDTWGRRVWLVANAGALVLVLFAGSIGLGFALTLSAATVLMRRHRTWRHLPDRRRAVGFGLGVVALVLLGLAQPLWGLSGADGAGGLARRLGAWAQWSLGGFWLFSLFHLAVNMRLHFLRLRPKLAVSAFLIGVLPLLLLIALGMMITYTTLGGARAARLDRTLESWRVMADRGADLSGALFDTTFAWPGTPDAGPSGASVVPAPAWTPTVAAAIGRLARDEARVSRVAPGGERIVDPDTTAWFLVDGAVWLMRWEGLDGDAPRTRAWQMGPRQFTELSRILSAGLDLSTSAMRSNENGLVISTSDTAGSPAAFADLSVSYRDTVGGYWNRYLFFGGSNLETFTLVESNLEPAFLFIQLRVGWTDLVGEFLDGQDLNAVVFVALILAALTWIIIEIFAVFFGVRISEGIVTAVHALHRGTRRVAAGDLDTRIEIPNEDEFGDLADSFNEMITAVQHGRQIALANERLTQELETARSIQVRLLPSGEPRVLDFEIAGASIPSREIGGDYYDFLAQGDDRIGIAIGDVSGKGMPAALLMSNLQASLHGQVLHPGSVSGVVARVNDLLVKSTDPHMFATFFYGLLDAATGTFTCTNAGHNPPLLLRTDGRFEELTTGGLLLGMVGDQPYKQDTVTLAPGEVIVLYTDGITEAVGPSAEEDDPEAMFGEEQLHAVVRRSRHLPAAAIKDAILAAVEEHTSGVAQSDDITLVVIRRQG